MADDTPTPVVKNAPSDAAAVETAGSDAAVSQEEVSVETKAPPTTPGSLVKQKSIFHQLNIISEKKIPVDASTPGSAAKGHQKEVSLFGFIRWTAPDDLEDSVETPPPPPTPMPDEGQKPSEDLEQVPLTPEPKRELAFADVPEIVPTSADALPSGNDATSTTTAVTETIEKAGEEVVTTTTETVITTITEVPDTLQPTVETQPAEPTVEIEPKPASVEQTAAAVPTPASPPAASHGDGVASCCIVS